MSDSFQNTPPVYGGAQSTPPVYGGSHDVGTNTGTGTGTGTSTDTAAAAKDAKDTAVDVAGTAKDAAATVAGTGKQAATEVAQTGKDAALDVAGTAKEQATDLLGKTRQQLDEQVEAQRSSLVDTLRTLGDQLASMTENTDEQGTAVELAAKGRDRARSAADWLDQRDPAQVLDEVRRFGRERPGAFLLGAAVAGVVAGRLTRGVVAEHTGTTSESGTPEPSDPGLAATAPVESRPTPGRHLADGAAGTAAGSAAGTAGTSVSGGSAGSGWAAP
jgi:hypothetical protein